MNSVEIFFLIAGGAFGLLIVIATFMVVLPIYASSGLFVNKPNGEQKSGFHLFTSIEPGQVKIIVRGERPVRMIMNTAGKKFARAGTKNNPEYWEIIDGGTEDPVVDVWFPIRWWAKIVYEQIGLVFSGVYPFQKVREYTYERTTISRQEESRKSASNLVLRIKEDVSDHFRVRQFLFPVHVTAAETRDMIPLDIIGVAELEVTNPYKAAFGTDRWDRNIINIITDVIISAVKKERLDHTLTAENDDDVQLIARAALGANNNVECGIHLKAFRTLEINPVLDAEGIKAIQAEAIALQKAKATRIDGEARAHAIRAMNDANKAGGEHSMATMEAEALVRAAEAAGKNGGSVILMPGSTRSEIDPVQTAILAELKKLNERRPQ